MNDTVKKICNTAGLGFKYLDKMQLLRPLELAVLTVLCFTAGRVITYFTGWGNLYFSGFWVILVALIVSKDDEMKFQDLQWRLLAITLGVSAGFVVSSVFGVNPISLFLAVVVVSWGCAFFNWHQYQQVAIMSLAVLIVSNYLVIDIALWAGAIGRILEAAIGILLAYGVQLGFNSLKGCCKTETVVKQKPQ